MNKDIREAIAELCNDIKNSINPEDNQKRANTILILTFCDMLLEPIEEDQENFAPDC